MERLPLYLGLCLVGIGLYCYLDGLDFDPFGIKSARIELQAARNEIALDRAERTALARELRQVKKDHERLFRIVEEAYYGCNSATRERRNEKAVPPVGKR